MTLPDPRALLPKVTVLAGLVLLGAALMAAHGLFVTIAFGALAAVVCRRIQLGLEARGLGRGPALLVTVALFLVVVAALAVALFASVVAVVTTLADRTDEIKAILADLAAQFGGVTGLPAASVPQIDLTTVLSFLRSGLGLVTPAVSSLAMATLILVYLLLDAPALRGRMLRATSAETIARYDATATELWVYIRVRAILGATAAIADTVLLLVLGVPYAILWGLVSFLFSFVPNLGFIMALVPPTVFAFIAGGPIGAVLVVAGYVAINLAFDYVVQPRMMSSELDISAVVATVCILVWTFLVGPAGALLAVPLTIVVRAVLVPFPGARWFVALLGPVPGESAEEALAAGVVEPPGG
ncbi:MAG: AI-2E family transporter [Chloroflexota bacterium]